MIQVECLSTFIEIKCVKIVHQNVFFFRRYFVFKKRKLLKPEKKLLENCPMFLLLTNVNDSKNYVAPGYFIRYKIKF